VNDLEHVACERCSSPAYAEALVSGVVALVCTSRSCGMRAPLRRRVAPPLPKHSGRGSFAPGLAKRVRF
jgi:hypothetical protein